MNSIFPIQIAFMHFHLIIIQFFLWLSLKRQNSVPPPLNFQENFYLTKYSLGYWDMGIFILFRFFTYNKKEVKEKKYKKGFQLEI